ncbi:hypothetical protein VTI74DRAFT_661 [Chaetomium olivicolor]
MKYNNIGLGVFILGFRLPAALGALRLDIGLRNVQVAEITPDAEINFDKQEIVFDNPNSAFDLPMRCKPSQGKPLTLSADKKWAACCPPGTSLLGSPKTAFDCCGAGHSLTGSDETGYRCCPTGQVYNGNKCKKPDSPQPDVCKNGRVLVNGKCVCPAGTMEASDGTCKPSGGNSGPNECSSEVQYGKCYLFKMENGEYLGFNKGWYAASKPSRDVQVGKFKFCKDEECIQGGDVNPGDPIRILDLHGEANSGKSPNQWLNNAQNGGHIGRTPNYPDAGVFTISKWTWSKYCISGLETGVGPTCPSDDPALTFNTLDTESCMPVELVEVPCNIRDPNNNCLWSGSNKPCPPGNVCVPVPNGQLPGMTPPGGMSPGPGNYNCPGGSGNNNGNNNGGANNGGGNNGGSSNGGNNGDSNGGYNNGNNSGNNNNCKPCEPCNSPCN